MDLLKLNLILASLDRTLNFDFSRRLRPRPAGLAHRVPVTGADRLQRVGARRVARALRTADDDRPLLGKALLLLQMALLREETGWVKPNKRRRETG